MFQNKMKRLFLIFIAVLSPMVWAQNSLNLNMPQAQQSYNSDRVRAGDVECSMAIGSSTNVEFGVMGLLNQNDPFSPLNNFNNNANPLYDYNSDRFVRDVGVYARITIPIGAPKQRLNCNTLYQLELEVKRLEIIKLRQEINQLKQLQFDN